MASEKKQATESIHDRDRIIVRLPDGMRDDLAALAEANGRSMTSEVVAAIEKHLKGVDRVTQLWEFFEKHRENIEALDSIWWAIEKLERAVGHSTDGEVFYGPFRPTRVVAEREAREANMPPITAEQAAVIRGLVKEARADEAKLLAYMRASSIEEIRNFDKAVSALTHPLARLGLRLADPGQG